MFTPAMGLSLGLNYWETYFATVAGAIFSAVIFYFSASYFMKRTQQKNAEKVQNAIKNGKEIKLKKKFTRVNKGIIKVKHSLGLLGTSIVVPLFLSIPLGSIITAKFFRHDNRTFPLIILGIFLNAIITTSLTYLFR